MENRYTRRMTFNERAFVATDQVCTLVFDGAGSLDPERWRLAVALAGAANPGSRLVLKGHAGLSRWVDSGQPPRVRLVDASDWDGRGPAGAPFLDEPLPCRQGPTCEVVLAAGPVPRVIFRAHHGVMDGRGALTWAEDVCRALRAEEPLGANSRLTDVAMCRSFQDEYRRPYPSEHLAPTGLARGSESGTVWLRRSIKGRPPQLLARAARLTAEEAWRHAAGVVRLGIPVDLRAHQPGLRSTGNLSFALYTEVRPETAPAQIAADIALQLSQGREGMLTRGDERLEHLPLWLVRRLSSRLIRERHARGRYSLSGMLSNMGRVEIERFSGGGFEALSFWSLLPGIEYYPFFMVISGHSAGVELVVTMPRVLASAGRLEEALERIAQGLENPN